jgi:hypothetical protein
LVDFMLFIWAESRINFGFLRIAQEF